jgi:type IV pilus biogenesis protein CpaD/CtpE
MQNKTFGKSLYLRWCIRTAEANLAAAPGCQTRRFLPSPPAGEGGAKRRVRGILRAITLTCLLPLAACMAEPSSSSDWQFATATGNNIAMLADDPHDLYSPRRETPRDATRRDADIVAYRVGAHHSGGQP